MRTAHDNADSLSDPAPCYATAEDIALAERLRRKIEERYLAHDSANGAGPEPRLPLAA